MGGCVRGCGCGCGCVRGCVGGAYIRTTLVRTQEELIKKGPNKMRIELPFPPSVNQAYRAITRGKIATTILSKQGRQYHKSVKSLLYKPDREPLTDDLAVTVELYPRDRRKRDIDNYFKLLFDSLTEAGIWKDDSQIKQLHAYKREVTQGGVVAVTIDIVKKRC